MYCEHQTQIVASFEDCGSTVYYNHDEGRLEYTCECGVVDPDTLPTWLRNELYSIHIIDLFNETNMYIEREKT